MSTPRRACWIAGAPARILLIGLLRGYRATLAGWIGGQCRFYPSCSRFAEDAIRERGVIVGSVLIGWRVLRCNPYGQGGVESVPSRRRPEHESALQDSTA